MDEADMLAVRSWDLESIDQFTRKQATCMTSRERIEIMICRNLASCRWTVLFAHLQCNILVTTGSDLRISWMRATLSFRYSPEITT